jgi:hypothetical protein
MSTTATIDRATTSAATTIDRAPTSTTATVNGRARIEIVQKLGEGFVHGIGTSFLIDLPYHSQPQDAKQDAEISLFAWQKS